MDRTLEYEFVGFWKRVAAKIVDVLLYFAFIPLTIYLIKYCFEHQTILPQLVYLLIWEIVFLYLVVNHGFTPGKFVLKIRIVNRAGSFLTWSAALMRILPILIITFVHLMQQYTAVNNFPGSAETATFQELSLALFEHGGIWAKPPFSLLGFFIYIDIGTILFNKKKRAIHDFLAGSYVITKSSFMKLKTSGGS